MFYISFYTRNTGYEDEVGNLIESLEKFNLNHYVEAIDSLGSWQKNCMYKPVFIKKMLDKYPEEDKIVWIDADAIVKKDPVLFKDIEEDIAFHYCRSHWQKYPELLTGTMMFRNNDKIRSLLDMWIESCNKNSNIWEQKALQRVINNAGISIYDLPSSYTKIRDLDEDGEKDIDPVILHTQANRRYKDKI